MAHPNSDGAELRAAWRALDGVSSETGWTTIPIAADLSVGLSAGRQLPGNEEALMLHVGRTRLPPAAQLPKGRGFTVLRLERASGRALVLTRLPSASPELFATMAEDVLATLRAQGGRTQETSLQAFLARIRAWQEFMRREGEGVLSEAAELGLFGELLCLRALLEAGVARHAAIDGWRGPLDELHDFRFGTGGLEVKSTLASGHFPASISSLDQLDDGLVQPLYVVGVRLAAGSGSTLPELIDALRGQLEADPVARSLFNVRLLHAGYSDAWASQYTRTVRLAELIALPVGPDFPRLIRSSVSTAVTEAYYTLDLDRIPLRVDLSHALTHLGAC